MESIVAAFAANGPVWLLVCCMISGFAIAVRAAWQWGFREPDKNRDDEGGRMTRVFDAHIGLVNKLTEKLDVAAEKIERVHDEGCGPVRGQCPKPAG